MINTNNTDLHIHSNYSDGSDSPADIVRLAAAAGLDTIALTDHDTIDGIPSAIEALRALQAAQTVQETQAAQFTQAAQTAQPLHSAHSAQAAQPLHSAHSAQAAQPGAQWLTFIPGIEISADCDYMLHILGYFRADNYQNIDAFLDEMKRERHNRNIGIIKKLNGLGIDITFGEVAEIAQKEIFGRPHIAEALLKKGVTPTITSAFNEYLADGQIAYVKKRSLPPEECVSAIVQAGGLPVIAHPAQTGFAVRKLEALLKPLIKCGLHGIEAYYPENTKAETDNHRRLAKKLRLNATGGSDYHGYYRKYTALGTGIDGNLVVPDSAANNIMAALNNAPRL